MNRRALMLAASALLAACGVGNDLGQVQLQWTLGFGVTCDHAEVQLGTIRVRALDAEKGREQAAQTFSCSAGSGTLLNVPAGTYNLTIEGIAGSGAAEVVMFRGAVGGVVVQRGLTTDVGNVVMEKLPPAENPGSLRVSWRFAAGLCGANEVANVHLQLWRDLVYKQHDQTYPCDVPAPGYVTIKAPPGKYALTAQGLNADGRVTRRAAKDSIDIRIGETTSLVDDNALTLK